MSHKEQALLQYAVRARYEAIVAGQRDFFNIPAMVTPRIPRIGQDYGTAMQRVLVYSWGPATAFRPDRSVDALPRNCAKLLMEVRRALFVAGAGPIAVGSLASFLETMAVGGLLKNELGGDEGWRASQAFVAADIELLDPHVIMPARAVLRGDQGSTALAFLRGFGRLVLPFDAVECAIPVS